MGDLIINTLKQIGNSAGVIWLLLAVPLLLVTWQYLVGKIYYGEYIHVTGEFSARLLILTLAVTPLRLAWPGRKWTVWLMRNRRYFGIATFAYAVPHLLAYMIKIGNTTDLIRDAIEPGMWTGWLALLLFLPLAITSNNMSVQKLGRKWQSLHRLVYFAAIFTFLHWILVAFDPVPGMIHVGVLVAFESYRLWKQRSIPN